MVENISQTIFFVKPKDVRRGSEIYGYLFEKLAGSSLVVAERKFTSLPYEAWMGFYSHLEEKYPEVLEQMAQDYADKEIDLSLLQGPLIVEKIKRLVGPTLYEQNPPWTIRGKFGPYVLPHTIVHASDPGKSQREIDLLKKYGALICKT